jgi:hypothetical protein
MTDIVKATVMCLFWSERYGRDGKKKLGGEEGAYVSTSSLLQALLRFSIFKCLPNKDNVPKQFITPSFCLSMAVVTNFIEVSRNSTV